jgi:hypothetical protein
VCPGQDGLAETLWEHHVATAGDLLYDISGDIHVSNDLPVAGVSQLDAVPAEREFDIAVRRYVLETGRHGLGCGQRWL